jgi:hypothetical protein
MCDTPCFFLMEIFFQLFFISQILRKKKTMIEILNYNSTKKKLII